MKLLQAVAGLYIASNELASLPEGDWTRKMSNTLQPILTTIDDVGAPPSTPMGAAVRARVCCDQRKILMKRPGRQQIQAAPEGAGRARTQRLARGEREPLDDRPDGPPEGDSVAMEHYLAAFRDWHEKHVGPVTDAEFQRVRADHGLT